MTITRLRTTSLILAGAAAIAGAAATDAPAATVTKKPTLTVTTKVVGTPAPGRASLVRVTIANRSTRPARAVVVRIAAPTAAHRLSTRQVRIATVPARGRRTVAVRVTPRRATALRTPVRITATARGFRGATARVVLRRPATVTPTPPVVTDPFAGRIFTHFNPGVSGLIQPSYDTIVFLGGGWAHWGMPKGGTPTCAAKTGTLDPNRSGTEGCVPYAYDASAKSLTVDGQPITIGTAEKGGTVLTAGTTTFVENPLVPKGARYDLTLKNIFVYGLFPNQVVSTTWLAMSADGRFVLSGLTMGSGFDSYFGAVAPDKRGTYEFTQTGQVTLTFDDGTVSRRTAMGAWMPDAGQTYTPATQWMVLDGTLYSNT